MSNEHELKRRLAQLADLPGDAIDPGEGALLIAGLEHPGLELGPYWHLLDEIRASISAGRDASRVEERHALLNSVLLGQFGFRGDCETYEDPDNADMIRVMDRRMGLPVILGILYLHAARANGWMAHGLAFPRHFLVRLEDNTGRRLILDPFYDGRRVDPADLRGLLKELVGEGAELTPRTYADVDNRDVLLRLCGNVQLRRMQLNDHAGTLRIIESALLFSPKVPSLWRDAGLVTLRLGRLPQAIVAFERFLSFPVASDERVKVSTILKKLSEKPLSEHC